MQTYTITTTHQTSHGTDKVVSTGRTVEQVERIKVATRASAERGDTITHKVTAEH